MCTITCGITTMVVGVVLVGVASYIGFGLVPVLMNRIIEGEVQLINGTEQFERFEEVPFPLEFNVRIFTITNPDEVLAGGVAVVKEVGPYKYKATQKRAIESMDDDTVSYRRIDLLEFDAEGSYPLTEDDEVTVVNVAYHGILQMAEKLFPQLMGALNLALTQVFGVNSSPIMTVTVGDLLFHGLPLCKSPGIIGAIACAQIRTLAANVRNIKILDDGSMEFAIIRYKHEIPSEEYVVSRGLKDSSDLAIIQTYNGSSYLNVWADDVVDGEVKPSKCNMVNGTDSGIFPPFINRENSLYALNTDICRSAELRYQYDTEYEGIPAVRYSANEWFLDNDEGCFCLNTTSGITGENGCLLKGAIELYGCIGALLVLTYPHFLYADFAYRNGVIGVTPVVEDHRIFVDLEPFTGTVIRGMKRAQFNIFLRPITGISATQSLRVALTPILWVEEGMNLPEEYVDMMKNRLLKPLNLVDIFIPLLLAVCALVVAVGVVILIRVKVLRKGMSNSESTEHIQPAN